MKKLTFLLLLSLILMGNTLASQVSFQKGYIINNSGDSIPCYIENKDWKKNPTSITYKVTKGAKEETLVTNQMKAFRIIGTDHFYKRYTIDKALAGSFFEDMQLSNSLVLLKVLVDGKFDLYELHTTDKYYFFYEKNNELALLDYRKTIDENNKVIKNELFKKQLFDNFKCRDFKLEDYSGLRYNSMSLSDFFSKYNQCHGGAYLNLHSQRTKTKLHFRVRGGLNSNSSQTNENATSYALSYTTPPFSGNPLGDDIVRSFRGVDDYNTNTNYAFGVELEMRLPFDRNNWSVFIAPNYQSVSEIDGKRNFSESNVANFEVTSSVSYSFIQIPIGVRRYFDINSKLEIYAHLAYTQNVILDSEQNTEAIDMPTSTINYDFRSRANREKTSNSGGYIGIGLSFLNKYAVDINYYAINLNLNADYQISMKGFAVNASYTIF